MSEAINAINQYQAAQQSREQRREVFENAVADYVNSQISELRNNNFNIESSNAIDQIFNTITEVAVNTNMFNTPTVAIQRFRQGASQSGNSAVRRILSGIANTIAMNHPDFVAQQPVRNIEDDIQIGRAHV